jgi:pimeloyl-ACP methyl ester carboxylesterase
VIRRVGVAVGAAGLSALGLRFVAGRVADRLLGAPRRLPNEVSLRPRLDALGGEVVRITARDGLRLAGRWLPAERIGHPGPDWQADPYEAILLLHGWSGSVAPDLLEYGTFLRRTAGVLGLDFRGHGDSDGGPTTFGLLEVEDVAGALAWLGERGIRRVAIVGTSMGGITALAATVVLGDGSLSGADADLDAPAAPRPAPRPQIVGIVADSVVPELELALADRFPPPVRSVVGRLAFDEIARRLGADPRATAPIRIVGLVEPVRLLLIHGAADPRISRAAAERLAAGRGPSAEHWVVDGAGHSAAHATAPDRYEARVTDFLRQAFLGARDAHPIIAATPAPPEPAGPAAVPVNPEAELAPTGRPEHD